MIFKWFKRKKEEEKIEKDQKIIQKVSKKDILLEKNVEIVPIITEKSKKSVENENTYIFKIKPTNLNKIEIKDFIEKYFNVKVEKVRTANYKKIVRGRTRIPNVRPKFKKAYVKLEKGYKIGIFE